MQPKISKASKQMVSERLKLNVDQRFELNHIIKENNLALLKNRLKQDEMNILTFSPDLKKGAST